MVSEKVNILVVFYSMYGNMAKLAKAVAEGVNEVEGATAIVKQVPELIPKEKIEANARPKTVKESLKDILLSPPWMTWLRPMASSLAHQQGLATCVHR